MQTGISGAAYLNVESRHAYFSGFKDEPTSSLDPTDRISIQGMSEGTSGKNPHFLAVLEERVVSFLA